MGFINTIKGLVNPDDNNDDLGYEMIYDEPYEEEEFAGDGQYSSNSAGMSINSSALELKVVKPERFDSVPQIADHLLNKRTVVLNLESTNKETARRLIDFLSGVAYSIDGQLKKVANNTYVITPCNVDVSGEKLAEQQQEAPAPEANSSDSYNF